MNEKTMRKWFKTFLMILPFLFLAIFAIGARAKGLEYYPKNSGERSDLTNLEYYDYDYKINLLDYYNEEDGYGYFYLTYTAADFLVAARTTNRLALLGKFGDEIQLRVNTLTTEASFRQQSTGTTTEDAGNIPGVSDTGILSLTVDEIIETNLESMLKYGGENEIEVGVYYELDLNLITESEVKHLLTFDPYNGSNIRPSKMTFTAAKPITGVSAAFYSFNDMIDEVMNFNAFGMNDFYDWMNENWFNDEAPLIVKPVFTLLVYEAIIELIFLMFSFITFVIRFAQQWIDGFYTKGGGK